MRASVTLINQQTYMDLGASPPSHLSHTGITEGSQLHEAKHSYFMPILNSCGLQICSMPSDFTMHMLNVFRVDEFTVFVL